MSIRRNNSLRSSFMEKLVTTENISSAVANATPTDGAPTVITSDNLENVLSEKGINIGEGAPTVITSDNLENVLTAKGIISGEGVGSGVSTSSFIATEGQTDLSVEFNPSFVFVYVDGVLMSQDSYTLNGFESITFDTALTAGEKIQVVSMTSVRGKISENNFTATEGQDTFTVNYLEGQVNVLVGGIKLRDDEFTAINGTSVILNYAASEGDWVQIITW